MNSDKELHRNQFSRYSNYHGTKKESKKCAFSGRVAGLQILVDCQQHLHCLRYYGIQLTPRLLCVTTHCRYKPFKPIKTGTVLTDTTAQRYTARPTPNSPIIHRVTQFAILYRNNQRNITGIVLSWLPIFQ